MQAELLFLLAVFFVPIFHCADATGYMLDVEHTFYRRTIPMTESKLRTAYGYIRVSTHDQEELSPDSQERLLRNYAAANNIFLEHVFADTGISGRKADKRPGFQEMIARAKSKEHPVDVLLVWKFSRFARNQEESIVYKSLLKKAGVDVISVSEPLADGPFGSLIERIIEWMDEYYSIRLSGEVKRGMTEKALQGGYMARAPFGYRNADGSLQIIPEEAAIIRMIYRRYLEDHTGFSTLARTLNDTGVPTKRGGHWENRTVKYILQNPVYKGYARWNVGKRELRGPAASSPDMIVAESQHEAIIPPETFDAVQERIAAEYKRPKSRPAGSYSHWLGNLVKCSDCGGSMTYTPGTGGFQCIHYAHGKCSVSHYISGPLLETAILDTLDACIQKEDFEFREELATAPAEDEELVFIRESLGRLAEKEKRIKAAYQDGIDTLEEYKQNKELLSREQERLSARLQELTPKQPAADTDMHRAELRRRIHGVTDILRSEAPMEVKSEVIRSICDKIVYDRKANKVLIYCVFRAL